MVDKLTAIRLAHAFLNSCDLSFIEIHELTDRLCGKLCAAAFRCFSQTVQTLAGRGIESQSNRFVQKRCLRVHTVYKWCFTLNREEGTTKWLNRVTV